MACYRDLIGACFRNRQNEVRILLRSPFVYRFFALLADDHIHISSGSRMLYSIRNTVSLKILEPSKALFPPHPDKRRHAASRMAERMIVICVKPLLINVRASFPFSSSASFQIGAGLPLLVPPG